MSQLSPETREKIANFVRSVVVDGNWESVSDNLCYMINNGKIISERDISYAPNGDIYKIKGVETDDNMIQIKEKKKPLVATLERGNEPIPMLEELRNRRRRVAL